MTTFLLEWLTSDSQGEDSHSGLDVAIALFQFYGGVVSPLLDATVTHVVVDPAYPERLTPIEILVQR